MASVTSHLADVVAQFLSTVFGRGCYIALQIYLARILGPHGFGVYTIGWTVIGLVGTLAPLGMPQAVLRYGLAGRRALRSAPAGIAVLAGAALAFVLFGTAEPIARNLFHEPGAAPVIEALAPALPLLGLSGVSGSALRAAQANITYAAVGALASVVYLTGTLLAFAAGFGRTPATAGYAYTVSVALMLVPTALLLDRRRWASTGPALRQLVQFGVVSMFIHAANVLNLLVDRLVIGIMTDARTVGLYQVAAQLAAVAIMLRGAVYTVFEARVPKLSAAGSAAPRITREFLASSRLLLHASAPGLVCLAVIPGFWIRLLFGARYVEAAVPLSLLAICQLGLTFLGPALTALYMTGEEGVALRLTIGTCVLNVVGNIVLIPFFGLVGSAVATGIANVALGAACLWRLRRTGRLGRYFVGIRDILLATVAAAMSALIFERFEPSSLPVIVGMAAAAYIVYACVVAFMCHVEDETIDFARSFLRRARG
jgi:O-antigen/teichoic acid export membrane protein